MQKQEIVDWLQLGSANDFNGFNSVPLVETIIIIIAIAVYFVLKLFN